MDEKKEDNYSSTSNNLIEFRNIMNQARVLNIRIPKDIDIDKITNELYEDLSVD